MTSQISVITIVLGIFSLASALQISQDEDSRFTTTKSYRKVHDDFYQIIEADRPVEEALNKALTWDVEAQYEHFELLEEHVKKNDKYAKYCKAVIKGAQELLDVTMDKIGIKREVDIRDYIKGLYDFEAGRKISENMQAVIRGINAYRNKVVEELEEEQNRARAEDAAKSKQANKASNQEPSPAGNQEVDQAVNQKPNQVENEELSRGNINQVSDQAEIPKVEPNEIQQAGNQDLDQAVNRKPDQVENQEISQDINQVSDQTEIPAVQPNGIQQSDVDAEQEDEFLTTSQSI
ncbi:uncharacterized protein LOC135848248 [Planococcus citri]|uniref:uncharacterized protein LOC135848248 n=1 Tax=Planococcus citri TaxID=170843 RepID=UPI0031F8CE7C